MHWCRLHDNGGRPPRGPDWVPGRRHRRFLSAPANFLPTPTARSREASLFFLLSCSFLLLFVFFFVFLLSGFSYFCASVQAGGLGQRSAKRVHATLPARRCDRARAACSSLTGDPSPEPESTQAAASSEEDPPSPAPWNLGGPLRWKNPRATRRPPDQAHREGGGSRTKRIERAPSLGQAPNFPCNRGAGRAADIKERLMQSHPRSREESLRRSRSSPEHETLTERHSGHGTLRAHVRCTAVTCGDVCYPLFI